MLKRRFDAARDLDSSASDDEDDDENDRDHETELGNNLNSFQQRFLSANFSLSAVASVADAARAAQALRDIEQLQAKEAAALMHRRQLLLLLGLGVAGVQHFEHLSQNPRRSPIIVERKSWSKYLAEKTTRGTVVIPSVFVNLAFYLLNIISPLCTLLTFTSTTQTLSRPPCAWSCQSLTSSWNFFATR
jgi:hypothetical protein